MADEKSIQDPVVKALAEHICSFPFQRTFEEFFLKHALSFNDEQEHQLNYMTIYLEFQQLFNQQMEGMGGIFASSRRSTLAANHQPEQLSWPSKASQRTSFLISARKQ
ncbi:hypothetical protein PINS_up007027 [Pythium insidiosum]|nr:hypothetical protein PINS_up007027 [Pythium insidiosum]